MVTSAWQPHKLLIADEREEEKILQENICPTLFTYLYKSKYQVKLFVAKQNGSW